MHLSTLVKLLRHQSPVLLNQSVSVSYPVGAVSFSRHDFVGVSSVRQKAHHLAATRVVYCAKMDYNLLQWQLAIGEQAYGVALGFSIRIGFTKRRIVVTCTCWM